MLTVILVFVVFSVITGVYDWYVIKVLRARKALAQRGVVTRARIVDVGTTTGALAVSSTVVTYVFEPSAGREVKNRVVLSAPIGPAPPRVGDVIDIIYTSEDPEQSEIVGNPGNVRSLMIPLVPLNMLWFALLLAVFFEAFESGG